MVEPNEEPIGENPVYPTPDNKARVANAELLKHMGKLLTTYDRKHMKLSKLKEFGESEIADILIQQIYPM